MITAKNEKKGGNYTLVPAGTHVATCYQMVELGTITTEFNGEKKEQRKVRITFELPNELMNDGRPLVMSKDFTLSMHEKATLRKTLEGWRGKAFTDDEAKSFDVSTLIGKPCMLSVIHTNKGETTYANISSVSALPKGMSVPKQVNDSFVLSYDSFDHNKFETLPTFLKDKMKETPEYKALVNNEHNDINVDDMPF